MGNDWDGVEMEFDEPDRRGVHRIRPENILMREKGVEVEADCPNCSAVITVRIPWKEIPVLAVGKPVPELHPTRTGFVGYGVCDDCFDRLVEQDVSEKKARKAATSEITITMDDIWSWLNKGRAGGRISKQRYQQVKNYYRQQRRRPPRPPAQGALRRPGRPRARRQPRNAIQRRRGQ